MENVTVQEGKTAAIISYITWLGPIVALILNNEKKNPFASFHIRQMVGLTLFSIINAFVIRRFAGGYATWAIDVILFVFWVIGFIGVVQGEEKKIPLLGDLFQDWFNGIG